MTKSRPGALILIFNPDTDYALAAFDDNYTSPKAVTVFTDSNASMLSQFAAGEDIVVAYSDIKAAEPAVRILEKRGYRPIIRPWGWNPTIRRRLMAAGVSQSLLPSTESLEALRDLAHRRTTITANNVLNERLIMSGVNPKHISPLPREFRDAAEAFRWLDLIRKDHREAFFKMPWSSSGRGILYTKDFPEERKSQLGNWLAGAIRRQGSVMGEVAADKCLDFATEWWIGNADHTIPSGHGGTERYIRFLGFSLFRTAQGGRYIANSDYDGSGMLTSIRRVAPDFGETFIEAQREMLRQIVAPGYSGPVGIDMLATRDGAIRSCIELNLRLTMGLIRTPCWRQNAITSE